MPKQQRPRKRAAEEENESAGDEPQSKKTKKAPFSPNPEPQNDDDGNPYWLVSNKRRLQVSEYKGITMISIREYYEKDGKTLPGKGISLTVEQFNAMSQLLPQVESVLKAKDLEVVRPQYETSDIKPSTKPARKPSKEDADVDQDDEEPLPRAKGKLDRFKLKANHEATSDEDD